MYSWKTLLHVPVKIEPERQNHESKYRILAVCLGVACILCIT